MAELLGVEQGTISKGEAKADRPLGPALQAAMASARTDHDAAGLNEHCRYPEFSVESASIFRVFRDGRLVPSPRDGPSCLLVAMYVASRPARPRLGEAWTRCAAVIPRFLPRLGARTGAPSEPRPSD